MDYSKVKIGSDGKVSNAQECLDLLGKQGFPNPTKIKFSTWIPEWKEAYYAYRGYGNREGNASIKQKKADIESLFNQLLSHLKDDSTALTLVENLKSTVMSTKSSSETYLTALFGTEQPKADTTVTFLTVSVRTSEGGRFSNDADAIKALQAGASLKYDDKKIFSMIEKIKERGFELKVDSIKRTITFVK